MMPAAKHFDPVLGVDIHIVQPPGPVPPVPIPHPFIGMVVDPMDYVPILGATVMVGGICRAQAGTAGKNIPSHIPIGGVFVKPPGNECEVFMGSSTVLADGDAFSHLGHPALSCQDIGIPPPPRAKKKSKTKSLVLPTSVVLSIPSGVLVGGPPTISMMALGMRAGMAALGKLFKKVKALRKGRKGKGKKGKGKGKSKDNTPCGTDAHPVDVVTGACVDTVVDYRPDGAGIFSWTRHYDSSENLRAGPMGRGFRHGYEMFLELIPGGIRYTDEIGETVEFPAPPEDGEPVAVRGLLLRSPGRDQYEILELRERFLRFAAIRPGGPALLREVQIGSEMLRISHDADGRPVWFRDRSRHLYYAEYDAAGRVAAVHEKAAVSPHDLVRTILRFHYDAQGCLTEVRDAFGNASTYSYEALRLISLQDRRGYRFHYSYDEQGRVVRTTGEDGLWEARLEYFPGARMTVVHYGDGGTWTKFHDENGMVTDIVQPDGSLVARRMNDDGRVAEEVDGEGLVTTWEYDSFGALEGRRDHLGRFLLPPWVEPDPPDFETPRLPEAPAQWEYGARMTPDHPRAGEVTRALLTWVPPAARQALDLDRTGSPVPPPRVGLDAMGRRVLAEYHDGTRETWRYDAEGNWVEFRDRAGSVHRRTYRSWNLLESEADPLGNVTRYEHSLRGQILRCTDPGGTVTEFQRDPQERITHVIRAGEVRESYTWNASSRLTELRGSVGQPLVTASIGPDGLTAEREFAAGGGHTLGYDERGRPAAGAAPDVEVSREWDSAGRRIADARDGGGVEHEYTWEGILRTAVLGGYSTDYEYRDPWDWDVVDPTGARHAVRIHPRGLGIRRLSSGRIEVAHFGAGGRCLGKHVADEDGDRPWTRVYRYGAVGELLESRDSSAGRIEYRHDEAHRVVAEERFDGVKRAVRYDGDGNILTLPGRADAAFGSANRLLRMGDERFEYDTRQHLSARRGPSGTTRFHYDGADMLVRIDLPGDAPGEGERAWRAAYDPFGRRAWKEWDGHRVDFFWDGDRLVAERARDGSLRVYVYPDHEALVPFLFVDYTDAGADPVEGMRRFVFTNQVGAPVRVEDDRGEILWSAALDPYGAARVDPRSQIELNLRFPGHYFDPETGLHCNRFRYYSPELGRYLQSDPIGLAGGLNVYAYPADPLTKVDLLGLNCGDAKGAKSGGEGGPHSKSAKPGDDVGDIAKGVGMDPNHVKNLQKRAADRGERIIVRGSNPESLKWHKDPYNGKPCVSKPVDVKHKTAKPADPHAGLVTKDANIDPKTGKAPDPPEGYKWDDNGVMVKDPDGNAVHGDYDLQNVTNKDGSKVNTNDPDYQKGMNEDVCPEHQQFNHGANDDYRPTKDQDGNVLSPEGGDKPGRNPDNGESYLVVEPDGTAKQIDGTENLQDYYKGTDPPTDWPYPDYPVPDPPK